MKKRATQAFASAILALTALAMFATAAFAQQYNGGEVGGENTGGGDVAGETVVGGSGTLPFTGAELGLFVVAGLAILAAGMLLRRVSTSRATR